MKRTQITELLANIKKTFVSFFSILMFVALGVGVFLGISWAGPALENAADSVFDRGDFHHFQIQYPYGLTDDDLHQLSEVEGISQIETAYQSFQTLILDSGKYTVKVQSLGQEIDAPMVVEGELPARYDEMAFHAESAKELGVHVGDTITFEKDNTDDSADLSVLSEDAASTGVDSAEKRDMKYLMGQSFKVTAIIDTADYVVLSSETYGFSTAPSGEVNALAWVPNDAFDPSAFLNAYPIVNMRSDSLVGMNTFGDDYMQASEKISASLSELGSKLGVARYDDLHDQAQKKIDDAQKQIDDGKKKIADGEKELADGRAQLASKRAWGEDELDEAYRKLMAGQAEYDEAYAKYSELRNAYDYVIDRIESNKAQIASIADQKAQLDEEKASGAISEEEYNARLSDLVAEANSLIDPLREYDEGLPVITEDNFDVMIYLALSMLDDYRNIPIPINGETMTLNEAAQKLDEAKAKLDAAYAELQDGWNRYYEGWDELNAAVAEAEWKIADGERQLAGAKQLVAENEPKLEDAKKQLEGMSQYEWSVLPRAYNAGAVEVSTFSGVTGNLSISMAALFIIVGLLVSYFAVSRIVREQITQIGTKKALGFRKGEITKSYLWYSGIAVGVGAIIGAIMGFLLVEGIIGSVLGSMFIFGTYPAYFGWILFIVITLLELALILVATYLACRSILKEHAVELLRGEKPPTGKTRFYEKWGFWEKLPLFIQTIVNNCFNDKRRVLSTIVGVAGCTALIVTAITLNNDVLKSYDYHYQDVYGFNTITYVDSSYEGSASEAAKKLEEKGAITAGVFSKRYLMEQPDGESSTMTIVVPAEEESFSHLYFVNPKQGQPLDLSADGAWVSQAYAEHMGAKVGDMITIDGGDGKKHEVPILGIDEFWLTYHEMVVGRVYFEKEFMQFAPNAVIAQTGDMSIDDAKQTVSSVEGFDSFIDDATKQYANFEMFSKVSSAVVAIYLVLAALMAIVVLLNLNVMFVDEKKRELIVLMINGFSVKDAKHYISYDNIVLTALGIIVGLVLGCIMGSVTVAAIEPSTGVFVKDIDGWAVLIGILGSAILAIIMSLISLRRIPKFDLTDINRF